MSESRATENSSVWSLLEREESVTRRLGHGYLLALSLVAVLSITGLVIIASVLWLHSADAEMINVGGRQRMLSQRIAKLAARIEVGLLAGEGPALIAHRADELQRVLDELSEAHVALRDRPNSRFPGPNSASIGERFSELQDHYEALVGATDRVAMAGSGAGVTLAEIADDLAVIRAEEGPFLAEMNAIVGLHERESAALIELINDIERGLVAASLITLLLEALLIFRPALRLLAQTQLRLRTALEALAASERSKSALLEAVPDVVLQIDRRRICRLVHVPVSVDLPTLTASLKGRSLDAALPPLAARALADRISLTRESEVAQRFEITLAAADGERRLEARIALAGLDDVLVLLRDITEQRALEREVVDIASLERRSIGRDLHDGLCQDLAGLSLLVSSMTQRAKSSGPSAVDPAQLAGVGEFIERALRESRQIARALHPIALEEDGLESALGELARSIEALYGVDCVAEVEVGDWPLSIATATELYRIAQEAASNAARHSGASSIELRLTDEDGHLILSIIDDGVGLAQGRPTTRGGGMGLRIMEHRAHVIGAWLRVESREESGTTVTCELPNAA